MQFLMNPFMLLLFINLNGYLSFRYNLQNNKLSSKFEKKTLDIEEIPYLDFNILSKLDTNSINSSNLMDEASILLEDNIKIILNDKFSPDIQSNQILCASAKYTDDLNKTGWDKLFIKTYKKCPVQIQMWAAGFIEGALTYQDINNFYTNVQSDHVESQNDLNRLSEFYEFVDKTIDSKIKKVEFLKGLNQTYLNYWTQIALCKSQLQGIYQGYNSRNLRNLSFIDFYFINADGQISELLTYMSQKKNVKNAKETIQTQLSTKPKKVDVKSLLEKSHSSNLKEFWLKSLKNSHCSVFVKPLFDTSKKVYNNILVAHSTWDDYNAMNRIFKHYDFELEQENSKNKFYLKNHNVTFSSYPGCISSTDDFYLINDQMMVTETTLGIFGMDEYSKIIPDDEYIPDFMRILLSNRLANSAKEWIQWLTLINTGTYNSQWTIVDLKNMGKSINKENLEKESIFVLEQFPGKFHYEDMTSYIQKNQFWASYNVPFFSDTRTETGFSDLEGDDPSSFSYSLNIRGQIFKKKNPEVKNFEDLKHLILFNHWKNKDNSLAGIDSSSPAESIGSRYDLGDIYSDNFGEIDAKVCDFEMMKKHECEIISGPSHENLPPFKWSTAKKQQIHKGLIDEWNFDWIKVNPQIMRGN